MKVLIVGWGFPPKIDGGLDIHVEKLFRGLRSRGIDAELALPEQNAPELEGVIPVDTGEGDMVNQARILSQKVAEISGDYSIVHTHDWFGSEAGFKASKHSDCSWVATFHSLSSGRTRTPSGALKRYETAAAEEADELIAVSEKLASEIEQELGRKPRVIHNGFSSAETNGKDFREILGIENNMIFFVGRHSEQKGIEHLLYGFKKLLGEMDATLVIGGKGHMTESLKEFSEMLGIEDRVIFEGFIPQKDLGDYYEAADVFVSPSINEPFGLTITEALSSGTPVVATDSGVSEIAGNSIIGCEPESDSLKEGILEALKIDTFSAPEGRSWEEMVDETIKVYRKL